MNHTKDEFLKNLELLRNRYIEALDVKIDRMKLAFESIDQAQSSDREIHNLLTLAHDMSGSCAFFGLAEMGEVAQVLEFFLQSLETQLPALDPKKLQKVWAMIQALESAKENSLQNTGWTPEAMIPKSIEPDTD